MLINRPPKLGLITLTPSETAGYSGPGRMYGSTYHQLAVQNCWGPSESIFHVRHEEVQLSFIGRPGIFELATQNPCSAVVVVIWSGPEHHAVEGGGE